MPKATLLVIHGADEGARFEMELGASIGIGRHVSNKVHLIDSEISREHARIESDGTIFQLVDLNSSNGTYVNGTAIETHRLCGGDRVHVGRTVMVFSAQVGPSSGGAVGMIDLLPIDAGDQSRIVEHVTASR
ncbi:MAG: FHA domain-containing protein, partial [Planctomycetaceae bacterium]